MNTILPTNVKKKEYSENVMFINIFSTYRIEPEED